MKIILSQAAGGKTTKVAEIAAKYTQEGKNVHVLSNELSEKDFSWYMEKEEVNTEYMFYDYATSTSEIISLILNFVSSKVVFVDAFPLPMSDYSPHKTLDQELKSRLKLLNAIKEYTGKEIYVTTQANLDSDILEKEKLIVLDYEEYINLKQ